MECKANNRHDYWNPFIVLIETLWNVKTEARHLEKELASINRNIVECKGMITNIKVLSSLVLIETLWNVKEMSGFDVSDNAILY